MRMLPWSRSVYAAANVQVNTDDPHCGHQSRTVRQYVNPDTTLTPVSSSTCWVASVCCDTRSVRLW